MHWKKDHPRVCGKDAGDDPMRAIAEGSPPRVRERPGNIGDVVVDGGITPACAGKT